MNAPDLPAGAPAHADAQLLQRLETALGAPLPGPLGHARMRPQSLAPGGFPQRLPDAETRKASVLLPLCVGPEGLALLFIRRPDYDGPHAGQIAFPGGRHEGEESLADTALRETDEELGIPPHRIRLLGPLTPLFVWVSNHMVYPYVGVVAEPLALKPCPREVAEAFTVPLARLLDVRHRGAERVRLKRGQAWAPYFALPQARLWGASAMMLAELVTLLESDERG